MKCLGKHILRKSKALLKQTRIKRSGILSLSSSTVSQIMEPSHLLCTLHSPLSTCLVHWTKIRLFMGHMKEEEINLSLLVVNKTRQDISACPFWAILLPLFLKVCHYSDALLPSTDFYTQRSAVTNANVRMGSFHGECPELKQLLSCQGSYRSLCVTN